MFKADLICKMFFIIFLIPLMLNLIQSTDGLKCYACNNCRTVTSEQLVDCKSDESFCKVISNHKIVYHII